MRISDWSSDVCSSDLAPFVPVLAEHLARHARRRAVVAEEGLQLEPGTIHVAPGTAHVRLSERRGRHVISLDDKPAPSGCRPSADPMFEAVAAHFGSAALAVVLSGDRKSTRLNSSH